MTNQAIRPMLNTEILNSMIHELARFRDAEKACTPNQLNTEQHITLIHLLLATAVLIANAPAIQEPDESPELQNAFRESREFAISLLSTFTNHV